MNLKTVGDLDNKLVQRIDGLMLGDGGIEKTKKNSMFYTQDFAHRYKLWALRIQNDFRDFGIDSSLTSRIITVSDEECEYLRLRTRGIKSNVVFPILWKRWYNGRINKRGWIIKTVPLDIDLSSPQLLADWYMGDGNYHKGGCRLATCGFTSQEVLSLCCKLDDLLNIKTTIHGCGSIYISNEYTPVFLDYIEPYKLKCFAYKWGE